MNSGCINTANQQAQCEATTKALKILTQSLQTLNTQEIMDTNMDAVEALMSTSFMQCRCIFNSSVIKAW